MQTDGSGMETVWILIKTERDRERMGERERERVCVMCVKERERKRLNVVILRRFYYKHNCKHICKYRCTINNRVPVGSIFFRLRIAHFYINRGTHALI